MFQDLIVAPTLQGVTVGAGLVHAHPVAPAAAVEDEAAIGPGSHLQVAEDITEVDQAAANPVASSKTWKVPAESS